MEEAFDLRSRLLPERRSVHGAGENAGTVCGKKQRFILHRHGGQIGNAGQGFVQHARLPVGMEQPLFAVRGLTQFDII